MTPILMMAPATLFTVLMIGFPFLYAGYLSLHLITLGSSAEPVFVGLDNYLKMFQDPVFATAFRVNFTIYFVGLFRMLAARDAQEQHAESVDEGCCGERTGGSEGQRRAGARR